MEMIRLRVLIEKRQEFGQIFYLSTAANTQQAPHLLSFRHFAAMKTRTQPTPRVFEIPKEVECSTPSERR